MSEPDLSQLTDACLTRLVGEGDREAAAEFVRRHKSVLSARYRWRLRRQPVRLAGTDDLLSTITRRVDKFVSKRQLLASGPGRLFSFVNRVADNASKEIVRRSRRENARQQHGVSATDSWRTSTQSESVRVLLGSCGVSEDDLALLRLRFAGVPYDAIADQLGVSPQSARQRFHRLQRALGEALERKQCDEVSV